MYHLIYRDKPYELESKDYEFSRAAVEEHWEAGMRDMRRVLAHPERLLDSPALNGVTTYDLCEEGAPKVKHPMTDPTATVSAGRRSGRAAKA